MTIPLNVLDTPEELQRNEHIKVSGTTWLKYRNAHKVLETIFFFLTIIPQKWILRKPFHSVLESFRC